MNGAPRLERAAVTRWRGSAWRAEEAPERTRREETDPGGGPQERQRARAREGQARGKARETVEEKEGKRHEEGGGASTILTWQHAAEQRWSEANDGTGTREGGRPRQEEARESESTGQGNTRENQGYEAGEEGRREGRGGRRGRNARSSSERQGQEGQRQRQTRESAGKGIGSGTTSNIRRCGRGRGRRSERDR